MQRDHISQSPLNMKLQNAIDLERYLKSAIGCELMTTAAQAGCTGVKTLRSVSHLPTKPDSLDPMETTSPRTVTCGASPAESPIPIRLKNILVPVDFSGRSIKSLRYAVPLAMQCGAKITLVHVVSPSDHVLDFSWPVPLEERRLIELERQVERLRMKNVPAEIPVNSIVRQGRAFDAILEAAADFHAGLIIIATHGHTGLERVMLGSTAENVVRRAKCPVLVIREDEHDFL
jgi:nucleotide-binding universal stress UspA family protein